MEYDVENVIGESLKSCSGGDEDPLFKDTCDKLSSIVS